METVALEEISLTDFPRVGRLESACEEMRECFKGSNPPLLLSQAGIIIAKGNIIEWGVREGNARLVAIGELFGPQVLVSFEPDYSYSPQSVDVAAELNISMGIYGLDSYIENKDVDFYLDPV